MTTQHECQLAELLCREGSCPYNATVIIDSSIKGITLKYYLCKNHWNELLHIWMESKDISFRQDRLSETKLVRTMKEITEVCLDEQHNYCKNIDCECECHHE